MLTNLIVKHWNWAKICFVKHSTKIDSEPIRDAILVAYVCHSINYRWMCPNVLETLNGWNEAYTQLLNIFRKVLQIIERIQLFIRLRLIYLKTIDTTNTTFANDTEHQFPSFWHTIHKPLWVKRDVVSASKYIMHDIIRLAKRTFHNFRIDAHKGTPGVQWLRV